MTHIKDLSLLQIAESDRAIEGLNYLRYLYVKVMNNDLCEMNLDQVIQNNKILDAMFLLTLKKKPSNWIEGMSMELKDKRRDTILRVFVYLIFIPSMCVLSWYGVYKLMCWLWCCHG